MPEINYIAVIFVAIFNIFLGMIWWHDVFFGKQWRELMGWGSMTEKELKVKQKESGPAYVTSMVSSLVIAFFMAGLLDMLETETLGGAFRLAWVLWVAFVATTSLVDYMYAERRVKLWVINYGYHLVSFIMMALILVRWK